MTIVWPDFSDFQEKLNNIVYLSVQSKTVPKERNAIQVIAINARFMPYQVSPGYS